MTTTTTAPTSVVAVLRGDLADRPERNTWSGPTARLDLEATLRSVEHLALPVTVRTSEITHGGPLEGAGSASQLRGLLLNAALRLLVNGVALDDFFYDPLRAARSTSDAYVSELISHLNADQMARLEADVRSHVSTLRHRLGRVPSAWLPRTSLRSSVALGGGSVLLRDDVDLVLGHTGAADSHVGLLDITTAPLGAWSERLLSYHALVYAMRTHVVPLRVGLLSTATGELVTRDGTPELIATGAQNVISYIQGLAVQP